MSWRLFFGKGCWLRKDMGEMELVGDLVEFMGYCWARKENKELTIVGKVLEIDFYHDQFLGLSVPMSFPLIRSVRQDIIRAQVGMGSQHRVRKLVTSRILTGMQVSLQALGVGESALWKGMPL